MGSGFVCLGQPWGGESENIVGSPPWLSYMFYVCCPAEVRKNFGKIKSWLHFSQGNRI